MTSSTESSADLSRSSHVSGGMSITDTPPADLRTDDVSFIGNVRITTVVAENNITVDHGNYAHQNRPPCMPQGDSRCGILQVFIPLNTNVVRVSLYCRENGQSNWLTSAADADAPVGWAYFSQIWRSTTPINQVLNVEFRNWSHDRKRDARMVVEFS